MEENKRKAMEKRAARMQQSQNASGITADEIPDEFRSQPSSGANDRIDSDEEDLENEMWNDLITSQQTSTQKPANSNDTTNKSKKPVDLDSDEEELERMAWNDISRSQVITKPSNHEPEYDDETDDDDEYEEYFTKLKGTKPQNSTIDIKSVADETSDQPTTDSKNEPQLVAETEPQSVDDDGQSLSILNEDVSVGRETNVDANKDGVDEQSQSSQSILDDSMNLRLSSSSAEEDLTDAETSSIRPQKGQSQKVTDNVEDGIQEEMTENERCVDEEATCLPDDSQDDEHKVASSLQDEEATCLPDDATCLPEDNSEVPKEEDMADLETQLPEDDDVGTMADANTVPMTEADGVDMAEADTVAMATQEMSKEVPFDTAEADTMAFEAMDTAEAETQAVQ